MDVPETVLSLIAGGVLTGIGAGFKVLWNQVQQNAAQCLKDRDNLWQETHKQNNQIRELNYQLRDLKEIIEDCQGVECPQRPRTLLPPNPQLPSSP